MWGRSCSVGRIFFEAQSLDVNKRRPYVGLCVSFLKVNRPERMRLRRQSALVPDKKRLLVTADLAGRKPPVSRLRLSRAMENCPLGAMRNCPLLG